MTEPEHYRQRLAELTKLRDDYRASRWAERSARLSLAASLIWKRFSASRQATIVVRTRSKQGTNATAT